MRTPSPILLVSALAACGGGEAPHVQLPVVSSSAGLQPVTTDLGWEVTVTAYRLAIHDLELTIMGETHQEAPVPPPGTLAHPGHAGGGEVTGALPGNLLVDFAADGGPLGTADLIVGDYNGANFGFRLADADDGLDAADPLLGHTAHIVATAAREDVTLELDIVLDVADDTTMIGCPFDADVTETSTGDLGLTARVQDPIELDSMFDGVDFGALPATGGVVAIRPGETAHNQLRRPLQSHEHYSVDPL
jgi:hypothetical protein